MEESATRRKRINRLKKMILGGVMMAVLIPVTASIILSVRAHQLSDRIRQQEAVIQELEDENKNLAGTFLTETIEESEREALQEEQDAGTPAAGEEEEGQKKIYLTFDDGPSSNTDEILDILKAYDVKATFFVVGKTDEASKKAYRRIVESRDSKFLLLSNFDFTLSEKNMFVNTLYLHFFNRKYAKGRLKCL